MATSKINNREIIKSNARRVIYLFAVICLGIIARIVYLKTVMKPILEKEMSGLINEKREIPATRGNIYAADGLSLLATSVPKYRVYFNPSQAKKALFEKSIDSLSICLHAYFPEKTAKEYKDQILKARARKSKYMAFGKREISHFEKEKVQKFPLFREKAYKGGGYFEKHEERFLPLKNLAMRTIGKMRKDDVRKGGFGLEASFENYLHGRDAKGFYGSLAGDYDIPVDLQSDLNAEPGLDIVTTLDINFQDIAESALKKQVTELNAKSGSAVIMEIATGHIKAITNLTKVNINGTQEYVEDQNYVIVDKTDPGSTFKLVTMAALFEHADLELTDHAVYCTGQISHGARTFTCAHNHGDLTVQQVFEKSCNIGIYELVKKHFGFENLDQYYYYLEKFHLTQATGFQMKGEPVPLVKNSRNKSTSSTTFPWMSIGYETLITPLQMLTFYNAVANEGRWVQPIIVKQIKKGSKIENEILANVIDKSFLSAKTLSKLRTLLAGVVQNGTAKNINNGQCQVAGKTGTAQKRINNSYTAGRYYTSFIGYFPESRPRYSCAVIVNEPQGANVYAADASAPVFKEIAEKIFAYDISLHPRLMPKPNTARLANNLRPGHGSDHKALQKKLGLDYDLEEDAFLRPEKTEKGLKFQKTNFKENLDQILGHSLKDILPVLENQGYQVTYTGRGRVSSYQKVNKNNIALLLQ
jgi:cell division protein FtsI (penicillin-binding protein 3)